MTTRRQLCLFLLVTSAFFVGCGGSTEEVESYESYFEEVQAKANEMTAEFASIQNPKTAQVAAENILRMCIELTSLFARSSELPDIGSLAGLKLKQRFQEHWKDELTTTFEELEKEAKAAEGRAGRAPKMRQVAVQMENLRKQIEGFQAGYAKSLGGG